MQPNERGHNQVNCKQAIKELEQFFGQSKDKKLYKFVMKEMEKPLIELVLEKTRGNKLKAAQILGINRNTLHYKIRS